MLIDKVECRIIFIEKLLLLSMCMVALQERVLGVKYGAWGRDKYGVKPIQVDAMEVRIPLNI